MRLRAWLGLGLSGLCVSAVNAQFASDRTPPPFGGAAAPAMTKPATTPKAPALPSGLEPVGFSTPSNITTKPGTWSLPGGTALPAADQERIKRVPTTIKEETQTHPWAVKAELGEWMICVKSYIGADSRTQAEKLAQDLRANHKVAAYVYERNSAERKAEIARVQRIRDDQNAKAQPFINAMQQAEKEAKASGMVFLNDAPKIKVPQPYHETPEQWAVLIGAFKTMDDAGRGLVSVKKLPMPKDDTLCDHEIVGGEVKDPKTGKLEWKSALNPINPYSMAFVARNPALNPSGNLKEERKLDAFEIDLNKDVKHNLLNVTKPFTIMVKAYTTPTKKVGDGATTSVFTKSVGSSTADILKATAAEAESLCAALRDAGMKPRSYESYLFHHRNGSIVCVGQFDAADDPELLKLQRELQTITFAMQDENKKPLLDRGQPVVQRLFDSVHPFPVPKK